MSTRRIRPDHQCDANHCTVRVDAGRGMCSHHWQLVPRQMQARIYAAARACPTRRERLSSIEFLESWADAVEHVAQLEGHLVGNAFRRLADMLHARQGIGLNIPDGDDEARGASRRERGCEGKQAYRTYRDAARAAKGLMRHTSEARANLVPYGCPHCGQFHFGHANASNR